MNSPGSVRVKFWVWTGTLILIAISMLLVDFGFVWAMNMFYGAMVILVALLLEHNKIL